MAKINTVVFTHGRFGEEIVRSAEMIVGKMENVHTFTMELEADLDEKKQQLEDKFSQFEGRTICFVDVLGGSPSTLIASLANNYDFELVAGVNLAMLLEYNFLIQSDPEAEDIADKIVTSAKESCRRLR